LKAEGNIGSDDDNEDDSDFKEQVKIYRIFEHRMAGKE
jgi:hypothetical protein